MLYWYCHIAILETIQTKPNGKRFHIFPERNITAQLGFEFVYFGVAVQHISRYTTGTQQYICIYGGGVDKGVHNFSVRI